MLLMAPRRNSSNGSSSGTILHQQPYHHLHQHHQQQQQQQPHQQQQHQHHHQQQQHSLLLTSNAFYGDDSEIANSNNNNNGNGNNNMAPMQTSNGLITTTTTATTAAATTTTGATTATTQNSNNNSNNNNNINNSNGGNEKFTRCCYPQGECFKLDASIASKDLSDCVRVICNNENCNVGEFMHRECFETWEQSILLNSKTIGGRATRLWSERQRAQNLWTKKSYDLIHKVCGCKCGRGQIRKDLEWTPTTTGTTTKVNNCVGNVSNGHFVVGNGIANGGGGGGGNNSCNEADDEKKKKKKRNRNNQKTVMPLTPLNSNGYQSNTSSSSPPSSSASSQQQPQQQNGNATTIASVNNKSGNNNVNNVTNVTANNNNSTSNNSNNLSPNLNVGVIGSGLHHNSSNTTANSSNNNNNNNSNANNQSISLLQQQQQQQQLQQQLQQIQQNHSVFNSLRSIFDPSENIFGLDLMNARTRAGSLSSGGGSGVSGSGSGSTSPSASQSSGDISISPIHKHLQSMQQHLQFSQMQEQQQQQQQQLVSPPQSLQQQQQPPLSLQQQLSQQSHFLSHLQQQQQSQQQFIPPASSSTSSSSSAALQLQNAATKTNLNIYNIRSGGGGDVGGLNTSLPNAFLGNGLKHLTVYDQQHLVQQQKNKEVEIYSEKVRSTSGCNGIFSRRLDFSSFNVLPKTRLNSYQVKIEDEGNHGNDETRLFILSSLAQSQMSRVACILCEEPMLVFDRYPLVDGSFFLSPKQHSPGCIEVKYDGRTLYLTCVCMGCLDGTASNRVINCRFCGELWDGSNLVLGTMYAYDIFAAMPCCAERLKCNNCFKLLMHPQRRLNFYSDYSHTVTCDYCNTQDTHFVKPLNYCYTKSTSLRHAQLA